MKFTAAMMAALLLLCGCESYLYDNTRYSSRSAALAAARADVEKRVAAVPVEKERVGGSVAIVIPTNDLIRTNGIRTRGNAPDHIVGYIVDVLEMGFVGRGQIVQAGKIFDRADIIREYDAGGYSAAGYDYKLWLLGIAPTQWQWYLSKTGMTGRVPINVDSGLERDKRGASFNKAIVSAAKQLSGTPKN